MESYRSSFLQSKKEDLKGALKSKQLKQKNRIIMAIENPLSALIIKRYNKGTDSIDWLGKKWDENDIKLEILINNRELFNDEEYTYYFQLIMSNDKKITKHLS